ncbi:MAG: RidA family protein [Actinobacteria bacterium]|nr:RidA family protein [Actinomycetota bacterium]
MLKRISPDTVYNPKDFGFVHATSNGSVMMTTGMTGRDVDGAVVSGSFSEQARQALTNIQSIVESQGKTMDDVMKVTTYVTDARYGEEYLKILNEFFSPGKRPASTMVAIAALWDERQLIEVEAFVDVS